MKRQILTLCLTFLILISVGGIVSVVGTSASPTPVLLITSVQLVPGFPAYLEWDLVNNGTGDAWVAPVAQLYAATTTPPGYASVGSAVVLYAFDTTTNNLTTVYPFGGGGWFNALSAHSYRVFSGPVVPANATWAVYNAYQFYNGGFQGWLYTSGLHYSTLR